MTPHQLVEWLEEHRKTIFAFMDYEATIDDAELATTLGYWFGSDRWSKSGHRFIHLGIDGTGSQFAAWIRPDVAEVPVVFFGSEGGTGVVAESCEDWPKIIAYAPGIAEYLYGDQKRLDPETNWQMNPNHVSAKQFEAAQNGHRAYREAVVERFGELPSFDALTDRLGALDAEFTAWCQSMVDH